MEPTPLIPTFNRQAALHGQGMSEALMARVAARKTFVKMKQCFMRAAAEIDGEEGRDLQLKVRHALRVAELWHLRGALFKALDPDTAPAELRNSGMSPQLASASAQAGNDTAAMPR